MRFFGSAATLSIAVALSTAVAVTACTRGAAPTPAASSTPTPLSIPLGSGRLTLTGSVALARDVRIKGCWVSAPGTSVLNGYDMTIMRGPDVLSGGVLVRDYHGDGTYAVDGNEMPAALALYLMRSPTLPQGLVLTNDKTSSLKVVIGGDGSTGQADFKMWTGGKPHPQPVSGSLTWTCGIVRRT